MTPRQTALARHALGLDGKRKQSYRNRFWASPTHVDFSDWQDMVANGYACVRVPQRGYRLDHAFWLTHKGAEAALLPGERLCPEDFPQPTPRRKQ